MKCGKKFNQVHIRKVEKRAKKFLKGFSQHLQQILCKIHREPELQEDWMKF